MNTEYIQTFGSFVRNSNYPLEADYIFNSEEELKQWEEANRKYLHEGLFKVVVTEDIQTLYWYHNETFNPLIKSDSLENLTTILKDFELHGTLGDLLRDLQNSVKSKLNSLQQELDETQAGAGLNGDGSFDQLNMKNTTYLDGSTSIVEALKALDREMSNLVVDAFIQDAYYDTTTEEVVITFNTKQEQEKTIRISMSNLIREWEPDNTYPTKVVELTREEVKGGGADKLSADVRISPNQYNILRKDNNTLLVKGTSDNILHGKGTVKEELDSLREDVNKVAFPDPKVYSTITEIVQANLRIGETFYLKNDISFEYEGETISYREGYYLVNNDNDYQLLSLDEYLEKTKVDKAVGLKSEYDPDKYIDNPYYVTDTKEILLNGENFGGGVQEITQKISDSNYTPETADIYLVKTNTEEEELQLTFTPLSPLSLTVPETIGDIERGTTSESLKGRPISEILDNILFKTIYPTITDPSVSLSASTATIEAGSTLLTSFTHTFNKGSVVVSDGVTATKSYVGNETSSNVYVKVTGGTANTNAGVSAYPNKADALYNTVTRYEPGQYQYKITTSYAVGPIMTTSKGASPNPIRTTNKGNVANPHPAGSVTSSYNITRNVTLPVWINPASGINTKQALKNWGAMTFSPVAMRDTSRDNPIVIITPRKLQSINSYNEVSGKYDVARISFFTLEQIIQSVNGANYTYYKYTYNGGVLGAVNMEIKTY